METPEPVTDESADDFKGGVHALLGTLLAVCAAYNVMRGVMTKQTRNAINAALYTPLSLFEFFQARHHWKSK